MRKGLVPSIEALFLGKGGGGSGEPRKGWEQEVGDNLPACSDKIADKAGNKDELKMTLLGDNAAKNKKSRKRQRDLDIEAGSAAIRTKGPKADGVKGVAESHTGEVEKDRPRPDWAEFDGLVMHGNTENKKECSNHDG